MDQEQLRRAIAAAKAGRAEGYEALLEAYGSRLYGYFLRATGSHHDAEDMLGETMVRLVGRLGSYSERGRFDRWLFRIAANMARDRIRRLKAAPAMLSISAAEEGYAPLTERLAGRDTPADRELLAAEARQKLAEALDKLDDTTRQMVLLRHMGEMSFKELARLFGCPLGTALARVHRGLRMLRKHMGGSDESQ